MDKSQAQQKLLKAQLWKMACDMRGFMPAGVFMNYCLGLVFFKYLSERLERYADRCLATAGKDFRGLWASGDASQREALRKSALDEFAYFLEPPFIFSSLVADVRAGCFRVDDLEGAFFRLEEHSQQNGTKNLFLHLFDDVDLRSAKLGRTDDDKNRLVGQLLLALDAINFPIEDTDLDILGDAYEYLLGEFAAGAGQRAGEFYTPQEVSSLLAKIVVPEGQHVGSVYDPTCGSGSLLLSVAKQGGADSIYGQEKNPTTYNLARMNMLLHHRHCQHFDLRCGDTLEEDLFALEGSFDAIVANPPFSAEWGAAPHHLADKRFAEAAILAPKHKADYAFLLHMVHHLSDSGTMACVLPVGVLYRQAAEGKIRRYLVEDKNYLDAVIGLPPHLFYGTSIPTCLLVLKKCRRVGDGILFIDASRDFERVKTQNKLLPAHLLNIIDTYRSRSEIAQYSHQAFADEIAQQDYNLNLSRYVDKVDEEPPIDLKSVMAEIQELEGQRADLDRQIENCFKALDWQI